MPAPNTPTKNIFLSYKSSDPKDRESAKRIKEILESVSSDAVEVFASNKSIRAGSEWRVDIGAALHCANYLIFLYTDRFAHWEWCHFEAGLFLQGSPAGKEDEEKRRIFCIHPATVGELPSPLDGFQHISLPDDTERLKDFLHELFVGLDPIRELWFKANEPVIDRMVKEIAHEVDRMAVNEEALCHYIKLKGKVQPKLVKITGGEQTALAIPDSYTVETDDKSLSELFSKAGNPKSGASWTWRDVKPAGEQPWISELATWMALYIRDGETKTNPIRSPFKKVGGPDYSPILSKAIRRPDDYSFEVLFLEQSWEQRDRTDSVSSFGDLMERLVELILSTKAGDTIRFMAYTPAIGFLAEKQELWEKLERCLLDKAKMIDMICLNRDDLARWHGRFEGKATARSEGKINASLIKRAAEVSTKLLERIDKIGRSPTRKKFTELPGFYLFKNGKRALIVAPVGVPLLSADGSQETGSEFKQSKVEMFGLDTNTGQILDNAGLTFSSFR